jgi:hypothetical protein
MPASSRASPRRLWKASPSRPPSDLATKADLTVAASELKSELLRFMVIQAVAIVGLTVALVRFLP